MKIEDRAHPCFVYRCGTILQPDSIITGLIPNA